MRYADDRDTATRWVYVLAIAAYVALVAGFAWNTEYERTKAEYYGLVQAEEMASEAAYAWGRIAERQRYDTTLALGDRSYPDRMQAITNALAAQAMEKATRAEARLQRLSFGRFHPEDHR
jgi:hypothetical protein